MNALAAVLFVALFQGSISVKCPFDNGNNCDCVADSSGPNSFESAECQLSNGKFTPFTYSSQYTITHELAIISDSANISIPASAFVAFKSINRLSFLNSAFSTVVSISLDPSAFNGVTLNALTFSGFNVLPLPAAVRNVGRTGLNELVIQNGDTASIGPNEFQSFNYLIILTIYNIQITSVSDAAFAGLEDTLQYLTLSQSSVYTYPKAISKLASLIFLDLSGNDMYSWPAGAFSTLTALKELRVGHNMLQAAIDSGVFNQLPDTVKYLDMSGGNLRKVPRNIMANARGLIELNLATNLITSLDKNSFPDNLNLVTLDLSENPIDSIDQDTFKSMKTVQNLWMRQMTAATIDLSLFNGMDKLTVLNLDFQRSLLVGVKATNPDQVPQSLQKISVAYTGLKSIDPSLEKVISRSNFKMLDFTRDPGLVCDVSLKWMAKYAVCNPQRVNVNGARCSNISGGNLLRDYLKTLTTC